MPQANIMQLGAAGGGGDGGDGEKMPKTDTIKLRNRHIGKSCQLFYRSDPLKIVRGSAQYLYDEQGTRYLDCINNVAHVGHCHPRVVAAGSRQMSYISTNNRFLHDDLVLCAQKLTDTMPAELSVCYFVNSGSEANDLALRLARNHTKRQAVITLDHAYHGHVTAVMEVSPYKFNQPGAEPKPDYVHVASCPDVYRGQFNRFNANEADLARLYADEVRAICASCEDRAADRGQPRDRVAAYIAETLQSCGGQVIPPQGYFEQVYKHVREAGGVCIADEVQVGFGRTGSHYWAFQAHNVVPDIVSVAKPMGNGHPVGAVVTTQAIADSFAATGVVYFNTYGGNPVSCAIANAVMDVIRIERLQQNAALVGEFLLRECFALRAEFPLIGDVRGVGLFVGLELIRSPATRAPATAEAHLIVERMKSMHHILISSDGPADNVLKLKPPMVFTEDNGREFLVAVRECLQWVMERGVDRSVEGVVLHCAANAMQSGADVGADGTNGANGANGTNGRNGH